ncbi:Protein N-acetyltransferase, RimJ/RimL family [Roseivivax lentus]|uniref:Protein N-acetyltransferase, RimJ/RimL family n=1 Tax=Roseivivax lentus TaxID=633194 RepID=A0A1N7PSN0_9RHOB|nr:GNAT family N-acetyltransferase [Roseivivax lentus]SIT13449.1 Protein N-acetyltransferase, RimJ/RimL family [Roseivivax lentus]
MRDFTTDRLSVRDWTPILADPPARAALGRSLAALLTPPVMRHLPDRVQRDAADPALDRWMTDRAEAGCVFTVTTRAEDTLIGLLFVSRPDPGAAPDRPERALGYLLAEAAWGKGFASKLVRAACAVLGESGTLCLFAAVETDNRASSRVLEKAGFLHDPAASEPGLDTYRLVRAAP